MNVTKEGRKEGRSLVFPGKWNQQFVEDMLRNTGHLNIVIERPVEYNNSRWTVRKSEIKYYGFIKYCYMNYAKCILNVQDSLSGLK